MSDHYILNERGEPVPCDLMTWAEWYETADRTLASTLVEEDAPRLRVSTVFLGLDHSFQRFTGQPHVPVLWETMIFVGQEAPVFGLRGGDALDYQERYASRAAAVNGHRRAVSVAQRMLQELDAKTGASIDTATDEATS